MGGQSETPSVTAAFDRRMMRRALALAGRGRGLVSPNPMVGAVLVREGQIVATGWHHRIGTPHAEVDALSKVGFDARGCTLYVTLEPCCHQGMTPPCTSSVLSSGVSRVVVGMVDPNPIVSGRGIAQLREAGIDVVVGLLEDECLELNLGFARWIVAGRPWVTLKMAATLDGRVADRSGTSRWITGELARRDVHLMRASVDAVMVGEGTVLADDPLLLPTMVPHRVCPARVVVSPQASIPIDSRLLRSASEGKVIVAASVDAPAPAVDRLRAASVDVIQVRGADKGVDPGALLDELGARRITSVLVEGGPRLAASMLAGGHVDRMVVYYAAQILADPAAPGICSDIGLRVLADSMKFRLLSSRQVGADVRIDLEPVR